jgi:hypothetical protein
MSRLTGIVAAAFVLSSGGPAAATTSRLDALRGDTFFVDETDVFRFPGLASTFADTLLLDLDASAVDGSGALLWHRPWTLGLAAHRAPAYDDPAQMSGLYEGLVLPAVEPVVDVLAAYGAGAHGFGLRFGIAAALAAVDDLGPDTTGSTGTSYVVVEPALGYTYDGPWWRADTALSLTFNVLEQRSEGVVSFQTPATPSFVLSHRSLIGPEDGTQFGIDVELTRRSYALEAPSGDPPSESDLSRWLFRATVGPHATVFPGFVLSGGLSLGYEVLGGAVTAEGTAEAQDEESAWLLPGIVAAVEAELLPWLAVRSGFRYELLQESHLQRLEGVEQRETRAIRHGFSWSIGLGLRWNRFRLDGTFAPHLFLNGPSFVGGGEPGMFGSVSLAMEY